MRAIIREEIGQGILGPRWRALGTVTMPDETPLTTALVLSDVYWPERAVVNGRSARRMAETHPEPTVYERMADAEENATLRHFDACRRARPEGM